MIYRKPLLYAGCTAVVLALVAWGGARLVNGDGINQYTNDAYVTADFPTVAPKVSGRIDRVIAQDNEQVHAGEELAISRMTTIAPPLMWHAATGRRHRAMSATSRPN